jgi:hypothetical protein
MILLGGAALRYRVLNDGRRQVLNIVLPGDFIGFPGCFFEGALYSVSALSDCVVSPVPFSRSCACPKPIPDSARRSSGRSAARRRCTPST